MRALRFALATGVTLLGGHARANDSETLQVVRLGWVRTEGAEGCLSERDLSERVRARLGRNPFSDDATTLIEGWVRRDGKKLRATVRVRKDGSSEASGLRELESDELDCVALGNAVTLAVALAIDPEAALAPPKPPEPPAPEPEPKPVPPK